MAAFGGTTITRGDLIAVAAFVVVTVIGLGAWAFSILRDDIAVVRSAAEDGATRDKGAADNLRKSIGNVEKLVATIDANVSGLREDIFALAGEFKNVDTRLEAIGNRLTTMEVRIDTFSQQLQEYRRDPNFPQPIPTPQ